jgi:MYXO-CTERM domain-containing protein
MNQLIESTRSRAAHWKQLGGALAAATALAATLLFAPSAGAEPAACLSPDPAAWPAPSKPYFMIAFDTSGSMDATINSNNSCGYPNDRLGHGRCAMLNTFKAYSGQANFGLASYARRMLNCSGSTCFNGCTYQSFPGNGTLGTDPIQCPNGGGCGQEPVSMVSSEDRRGANILVPMLQDHYWMNPADATNVPALLSYVDNDCTGSVELFHDGCTPLNGILRDMYRYYSTGWTSPLGAPAFPSPLGTLAQGERPCRSVNVILVTDGYETCDNQADAVDAAADLFAGFTKDGIPWKIKTYVIDFGNLGAVVDPIAAAGGTGSAQSATNETQLSAALSNILAGAVSPESCDNADNNCNGCTDEGYTHYCDVGQTCCVWNNAAQRTTCLSTYTATITAANPQGDLTKLPCTTVAQQIDPASWLCFDPKESCDNVDNNCLGGVDEGVLKCGSPAHCPMPETCNNLDDNCNGTVDEMACNGCIPSPEICDGCDNDCDGIADNGISPISCGLASPPNCIGTKSCKPPQAVPLPGQCVVGGGFNTCANNPQTETCDSVDNDCDGAVDDNVAPTPCVPAGTPAGLVYGGTSQCKMGAKPCGSNVCSGFVGPSPEICDGIDNDCDGTVDEAAFGINMACGVNQPPCTTGVTACVNGALVCQGGVTPTAEVCDGIDNDCDGLTDEVPLSDSPAQGQNGCWSLPGNCCTFHNLNWCPPPGGSCNDVVTLTPPCHKGTLSCGGAAGWVCQGPKEPAPEACDGIDNDCNGTIDDGTFAQVGQVCGSDTGECKTGTIQCSAGVLDCAGDIPPSPEMCDGFDNDCDGVIDNGIPDGGLCTVPYDDTLYPGDRVHPPCIPGLLLCQNGAFVCTGGTGPSPEVCDGVDNDCGGDIDEVGTAPDGVDGSANPQPLPAGAIGDACGVDVGECKAGMYACVEGKFACLGAQLAAPDEECDCKDNDCNGKTDDNAVCSAGKDCVKSSFGCQCAETCGNGEVKCPPGQICQTVTQSETGMPLGGYCVADPCEDCSVKTVKDANDQVLCAPAGTELPDCVTAPICACKGQNGCTQPCFGVTCAQGLVCTNYGASAGTCVVDNCYNIPCQGCDKVCHLGGCATNPCTDTSCPPDQGCKPSADFSTFTCTGSCAAVDCAGTEVCVDGKCVTGCDPACGSGKVCDLTQDPPVCVADMCMPNPCTDGACCDSITGQCGDCPCAGVHCPEGQGCQADECVDLQGTGGSGGGTTTTTSTGTGTGGAGGGGGATPSKSIWGLATGGGGCACEVSGLGGSTGKNFGWGLAVAAVALLRRRRRARSERPSKAGEGQQ